MAKVVAVAPLNDEKPLYQRQEEEPTLWWNRFKRYRGLGPKRSLQAAFEQEQSEIKALESTKKADSSAKVRKNTEKHVQKSLQTVPAKPQVPGSWKQASIKWHWVERAESWDTFYLDGFVQKNLDALLDGASLGFNRIQTLKSMLESLQKIYNANYAEMTIEQVYQIMARMQSILKDIREEMVLYDESVARVALKKTLGKMYHNLTPEEIQARTKK